MTQQEAKELIQQIERVTKILEGQRIKYRFYLVMDFRWIDKPGLVGKKFYGDSPNVVKLIRKFSSQIDLVNGRYELDISSLGCDVNSDWERSYYEDWSVPLLWLLDEKFQKEFEPLLALKRVKSLFQ
jgi:hypothetical protein